MNIELIVLGKNFYDFDGQQGANLVVYGQEELTNNKEGISISEMPIEFLEHDKVSVFPAKYKGTAHLVSFKNRSGKSVTGLKISNPSLIEEVTFIKKVN